MTGNEKQKCKISGKRIFETYGDAKEMMISFKNRVKYKKDGKRIKHRQGKPEARRVYLCPHCDGYHITKEAHFREYQAENTKQITIEKEAQFHKMMNGLWKEFWKPIEFDFKITSETRWEISNWGRVRSFNKKSDGNMLNGSLTEGYKVIRLKLYEPRDAETEQKITALKQEISALFKKRQAQIKKNDLGYNIALTTQQIEKKKTELSRKLASNLKKRTINHHFLIHRMVAKYFLPDPKPNQTIVAHFDYNKLNNKATNLLWMTPEENKEHQQKSPHVIAEYFAFPKRTIGGTNQVHVRTNS